MVPASSIPGTYGGSSTSGGPCRPDRSTVSVGFTVAAATRIRTSPGPGSGTGFSTIWRTSGPPNSVMPTARMVASRLGEGSGGPRVWCVCGWPSSRPEGCQG